MAHCGFGRRAFAVVAVAAVVLAAGLTGALADSRLRTAGALDRFLAVPGAADLQAIADVMAEINADAASADAARDEFMNDPRGFFAVRGIQLGSDRFALLAIDMVKGSDLGVIATAAPRIEELEAVAVGVGGVADGVAMAILPAFEPGLEIGALDSFFIMVTDLGSERLDQIPLVVTRFGRPNVNDAIRESWRTDEDNRTVILVEENFDDERDTSRLYTFDMEAVPDGEMVFSQHEAEQGLQALIEATFVIGEFFGLALMLAI